MSTLRVCADTSSSLCMTMTTSNVRELLRQITSPELGTSSILPDSPPPVLLAALDRWFQAALSADNSKPSSCTLTPEILIKLASWCLFRTEALDHLPYNERQKELQAISSHFSVSVPLLIRLISTSSSIGKPKVDRGPVVLALEGIDGSGKETQTQKLHTHLQNLGHKVKVMSYPVYNSFFGKEIGLMLSDKTTARSASTVDCKSMALWYALDRWKDWRKNIAGWDDADYILMNRSTMSSMVYQALRSDLPSQMSAWVEKLEYEELGLPRPHLFLVFDVSIKSSGENVRSKSTRAYTSDAFDTYESDLELQTRARELYREFATTRADSGLINCETDKHTLKPVDMIFQDVLLQIKQRNLL